MRHIKKIVSFLVLILFLLVPAVFAGAFQVTSIGSMELGGEIYSQLYYTSGNVTFNGIGVAGQTVTATIDSSSATTAVNDAGSWSYSATLADGDHTVSFSSDAGTVDFTLTIGAVPDGVGAISGTGVPASGNSTPTIIILSVAAGLILIPLVLKKRFI